MSSMDMKYLEHSKKVSPMWGSKPRLACYEHVTLPTEFTGQVNEVVKIFILST